MTEATTETIEDTPELLGERAARALGEHPWVREAVAADGSVGIRLRPEVLAADPVPAPLLSDFLNKWRLVFDGVYVAGERRGSDDLDLSGWERSDDGEPMPEEHMVEWVLRAVDLIRAQQPRIVLELGCGTGLLLHRLHPHLEGYVGTDISPVSVRGLQELGLPAVRVVEGGAHEPAIPAVLAALAEVAGPGVAPDCVVLNSVSMHFPNGDYMERVVRGMIDAVAPGGTVIIGDVRNADLFDDYRAWRGKDEEEQQLLMAPEFLADVAARSGRRVEVTVHAKTMAMDTELTRFRYDVVLHVDPATPAPEPRPVAHGDLDGDVLAEMRSLAEGPEPVEVHGIPNRLLLPGAPGAVTGAELLDALAGTDSVVLLDHDSRHLRVATPAAAGRRPAAPATRPQADLLLEPLAGYLRQRVPQALRIHLKRADRSLADVPIRLLEPAVP